MPLRGGHADKVNRYERWWTAKAMLEVMAESGFHAPRVLESLAVGAPGLLVREVLPVFLQGCVGNSTTREDEWPHDLLMRELVVAKGPWIAAHRGLANAIGILVRDGDPAGRQALGQIDAAPAWSAQALVAAVYIRLGAQHAATRRAGWARIVGGCSCTRPSALRTTRDPSF